MLFYTPLISNISYTTHPLNALKIKKEKSYIKIKKKTLCKEKNIEKSYNFLKLIYYKKYKTFLSFSYSFRQVGTHLKCHYKKVKCLKCFEFQKLLVEGHFWNFNLLLYKMDLDGSFEFWLIFFIIKIDYLKCCILFKCMNLIK